MPPTYTLSVPDPQPGIPPGDRWYCLTGPDGPFNRLAAKGAEWLLIAGAIEAGAPRECGCVEFVPSADGGILRRPRLRDRRAYLTTAELVELAADIRAKLAPPATPCHIIEGYCHAHGRGAAWGCPSAGEPLLDRPRKPDGRLHLTGDDPDVIASTPRPTVADRTCSRCFPGKPGRELIDCGGSAGFRACSGCAAPAIVDQPAPLAATGPAIRDLVIDDMRGRDAVGVERYGRRLRAGDGRNHLVDAYQEALDLAVYLRQEIEERAKAATPPTLPADLRGLLDALVAAQDARDAADVPGGDGVAWGRCDAEHEDAAHAVAEWHRAGCDVDAEPAPDPLSDGELISLWGQYVGSPPSPNGMTLMRAIRDHAGGGR